MAEPYGPNTPQIRRFLQRLAARSTEDCAEAARAYARLDAAGGMAAADSALGAAITAAGREGEQEALAQPLLQLLASHAERVGNEPQFRDVTWEDIAEAALAAALALLARDLIGESELGILYSPWAELIPLSELG